MIRWVLAILKARQCYLKFGTWRLVALRVGSGLQQGSRLSSVLFNIYTADLALLLKTSSTDGSTYVDDIIAEGTGMD